MLDLQTAFLISPVMYKTSGLIVLSHYVPYLAYIPVYRSPMLGYQLAGWDKQRRVCRAEGLCDFAIRERCSDTVI